MLAVALPFPLGAESSACVADTILESSESGKNTAAHLSNSLQSNNDLANRYLLISLASSAASTGSAFGAKSG